MLAAPAKCAPKVVFEHVLAKLQDNGNVSKKEVAIVANNAAKAAMLGCVASHVDNDLHDFIDTILAVSESSRNPGWWSAILSAFRV